MAVRLNDVEKALFTRLFEQTAEGAGSVPAGEAVGFLRQSGLNDSTLHQVWALSDPEGNGSLDQNGFFVAMKLIALAQANMEVSVSNVGEATDLPNFGDKIAAMAAEIKASIGAAPAAAAAGSASADGDWIVTLEEKGRYDNVFNSLQPENGKISGPKAKQVLVNSKLPNAQLGTIWEIADINKDGMLDNEEFAVAMYLVYKCLEGQPCPSAMPPGLMPPSKRGGGGAPAAPTPAASQTPAQALASPPTGGGPAANGWCVSADELKTYNGFFKSADKDCDGLVKGNEVMAMFMSSKLPKNTLAKVWSLCDLNTTGTLNSEQFALAMHLISQKVKGVEVPSTLPPRMIPPSMRHLAGAVPAADGPSGASASATAQMEQSGVAVELEDAKKQLAAEKKIVQDLETQVTQQSTDTKGQEAELAKVTKELAELKSKEAKLRQDFKEGKQKLAKLVEDIKKAKAEKGKIDTSLSRLAQSNKKIDDSLKQYGSALNKVKGAGAGQNLGPFNGSPARPKQAAQPHTGGMSMKDYFGAGPGAAKDPFGSDPF